LKTAANQPVKKRHGNKQKRMDESRFSRNSGLMVWAGLIHSLERSPNPDQPAKGHQ